MRFKSPVYPYRAPFYGQTCPKPPPPVRSGDWAGGVWEGYVGEVKSERGLVTRWSTFHFYAVDDDVFAEIGSCCRILISVAVVQDVVGNKIVRQY